MELFYHTRVLKVPSPSPDPLRGFLVGVPMSDFDSGLELQASFMAKL